MRVCWARPFIYFFYFFLFPSFLSLSLPLSLSLALSRWCAHAAVPQLAEAQPPLHPELPGGSAALGRHERGTQGGHPHPGYHRQATGQPEDPEVSSARDLDMMSDDSLILVSVTARRVSTVKPYQSHVLT